MLLVLESMCLAANARSPRTHSVSPCADSLLVLASIYWGGAWGGGMPIPRWGGVSIEFAPPQHGRCALFFHSSNPMSTLRRHYATDSHGGVRDTGDPAGGVFGGVLAA